MGIKAGLGAIAVMMTIVGVMPALAQDDRLSVREIERYLQSYTHAQKPKPAGKPGADQRGDDSCQYANDMECDEHGLGTGACAAGTDYSDCWRLIEGVEDDSCEWANDGECDEIHYGTGACTQATDRTDCGIVAALRGRTDSCDLAFNGVCDEGEGGACAPRTDRADCVTRERPMTIQEHYFGHDDRELLPTDQFPWSVIGQIHMGDGECTATLIARDILITAAHCIMDDEGHARAVGEFVTGMALRKGGYRAEITDYLLAERWDNDRFENSQRIDGLDWALLKIDQPLGDELGFVTPLALVEDRGRRRARQVTLYQAGYSWDTEPNLSGHQGCSIARINRDNTMAHECDTTRGDSGSPFLIQDNDQWFVVATDSNFRPHSGRAAEYIAALADDWIDQVGPFARGERRGGGQLPAPVKPGKPGVKP
ncbi:trypsin-like serine peptidase [Woodsholea maritima]|uniref:trypsin-like serine peptidase n=1 Tax=Woodsholea maritima TaxID=240237 RepID=UPI000373BB37|nr:trypsin-like serine protease [Woodsholea maritima]